MFKVDIKFDPKRRVDDVVHTDVPDFKLPPHGNSKDEDFDPVVHLELDPEADEDQDAEGDVSFDSDGNAKPKKTKVWKLLAPNLHLTWLFISPEKKMIMTKLQETLTDGLESL